MLEDRYGFALTTASPEARDAYVAGVDLSLSANHGAEEQFRRAIACDEGLAVAQVALARTLQVQHKPAEAKAAAARARELAAALPHRERSHVNALATVIDGGSVAGLAAVKEHLAAYPRDAMVLAPCTGVFGLIGFSGRAGGRPSCWRCSTRWRAPTATTGGSPARTPSPRSRSATSSARAPPSSGRSRSTRAMPTAPTSAPTSTTRAASARRGSPISRSGGRTTRRRACCIAISAGTSRCGSWRSAAREEAWSFYRAHLRPGVSTGPPINTLSNSASFLLRAEMAGEARDPELWRELSQYATQWFPSPGIAFADVHGALAHAFAGDAEALAKIVERAKGPARDVVAPLAGAFDAFSRSDWAEAAAQLAGRVGLARAHRRQPRPARPHRICAGRVSVAVGPRGGGPRPPADATGRAARRLADPGALSAQVGSSEANPTQVEIAASLTHLRRRAARRRNRGRVGASSSPPMLPWGVASWRRKIRRCSA